MSYSDKKIIFDPENSLEYETAYTVTIHKTVKSSAGLNMTDDYSWSFTTAEKEKTVKRIKTGHAHVDLNGDSQKDVYFDFSSGQITHVDKDAEFSGEWDLVFSYYEKGGLYKDRAQIRVNESAGVKFKGVDENITDVRTAAGIEFVTGEDARALDGWYKYKYNWGKAKYEYILAEKRSFVIKTPEGNYAMMQLKSFLGENGELFCSDFDYFYQDDGSEEFSDVQYPSANADLNLTITKNGMGIPDYHSEEAYNVYFDFSSGQAVSLPWSEGTEPETWDIVFTFFMEDVTMGPMGTHAIAFVDIVVNDKAGSDVLYYHVEEDIDDVISVDTSKLTVPDFDSNVHPNEKLESRRKDYPWLGFSWYDMDMTVVEYSVFSHRTFVFRTAEGKYAKLQVTCCGNPEDSDMICYYEFLYYYQDDGAVIFSK